jgi:Fe2+ or Zn2+ uptake regulation protein
MTNTEIKKFMLFLGYDFVKVGYYGTKDGIEKETKFQITEQEWIDKVGIDSVGEYFIIKNNDEFHHMYNDNWSKIIDFKNDWNWLIKVAVKAGFKQISTNINKAYTQCWEAVFS